MRTLRLNMRGSDVLRWQLFLIEQGFLSGTADGVFGQKTHTATIDFQRQHGLTADGVVGRQTLGLAPELPEDDVSPAVSPASAGALSEAALKEIMPQVSAVRCSTCLPFLQSAMAEFAIDNASRAAAFLAQLAHESGQLRFMEEIWGPTTDQRRYEPVTPKAKGLGNTQPGDGKRFKGRGPIQLTGRRNYGAFGDALGIDLLSEPTQAATPEVGFRIAGLYWKENGLNELADRQQFETITKRINGGFNGLEDRKQFYDRARRVLGVAAVRSIAGVGEEATGRQRRFSRGLDDPGEITPTAAERGPNRRARKAAKKPTRKLTTKPAKKAAPKRGAAKKTAAKKTAAKKAAAKRPTAKKKPRRRRR